MFGNKATAERANTVGEDAMEGGKGWGNLPLKEQALARAIVRGFAAELEQDRALRAIS